MKIKSPLFISSRLLPAVKVAGAEIALEFLPGRACRWFVDLPSGEEFSGADFRRPACCAGDTAENACDAAFEAFLSFMSAAGESFNYAERRGEDGMSGENSDLFPRPVTEFCAANSDEIAGMQWEFSPENRNGEENE